MSKSVRNVKSIQQKTNKTPPYDVIIPTAGAGHRMKCYGPKSLITTGNNTTILQRQLNMIKEHLHCNPQIIVVTGFQSSKVMNSISNKIVCIENPDYDTNNVARSIGMGLRASTTDHVIIMYGDLVFNQYAITFPIADVSTMVIDSHNPTMTDNEVGCVVQNGYIEQMSYGLPEKWAQIVLLTGKELELARNICWNTNNYNSFGFEVLNKIIEAGGKFKAYKPRKMKINDIDSLKDIATIKHIIT